MENILSRWLHRLAPPPPIRDLLDHPDLLRLTPHELDDLPMPRPPMPRPTEKNPVPQFAPFCK